MDRLILACAVCANPTSATLSPGQIRWHNHNHPMPERSPVRSEWSGARKDLPFMVVVRPGDRLIYETAPGEYQELPLAALLGGDTEQRILTCVRCHRRVLTQRPVTAVVSRLWSFLAGRRTPAQ
jgi:hypothetical protein